MDRDASKKAESKAEADVEEPKSEICGHKNLDSGKLNLVCELEPGHNVGKNATLHQAHYKAPNGEEDITVWEDGASRPRAERVAEAEEAEAARKPKAK